MCALGGYCRLNGSFAEVREGMRRLFLALQDRGRHAAGMAWPEDGGVQVIKQPGPASALVARRWDGVPEDPCWLMLHCRWATHGSPSRNANNHPVTRCGLTLTHNGVVTNKAAVMRALGLKPQAAVDTEAIVAAIAVAGVRAAVQMLRGSMSLAWVAEARPDRLRLYTNGRSPLVIGRLACGDFVYASRLHHLEFAGLDLADVADAEPGVVYTLTPKGLRRRWVGAGPSAKAEKEAPSARSA